MPSRSRVEDFARRLQMLVCRQLKANIRSQEDPRTGESWPSPWHDVAQFPNGPSDRAGQPMLQDTGTLIESIAPGRLAWDGNTLRCHIDAAPHGILQHRGFTQSADVIIVPRLQKDRVKVRRGRFDGIRKGDKMIFRKPVTVVGRRWAALSDATVAALINEAR